MAENYERVNLIGSGTFGRAWLVRRVTTGRQFVLKEMKMSGLTERERSQAVTEVEALARCRFVNVIRYREAYMTESHDSGTLLCIVMDYAEAGQVSHVKSNYIYSIDRVHSVYKENLQEILFL